ncbi:MAG: FIMAH domain-containing protein [Planctomycetota bacterium]|jgi:hypothetical protein
MKPAPLHALAVLLLGLLVVPGLRGAYAQDAATIPAEDPEPVVYVSGSYIEFYKDMDPWFGEARIESVLQELGYVPGLDYGVRPTSDLKSGIPCDTRVVIIAPNSYGLQSSADNVNHPDAQANLTGFAQSGGILVMSLADNLGSDSYQAPLLSRGGNLPLTNTLELAAPLHPMALGPDGNSGTADDLTQANIQWIVDAYAVFGYVPPLPATATIILTSDGNPVLAEYPVGQGTVLVTTSPLEYGTTGNPDVGDNGGYGSPRRTLVAYLAYAMSIAPEPVLCLPEDLIAALVAHVESLNLHNGISNSLDVKLDAALQALDDVNENNDVAAINALNAFINAVSAQSGNEVDTADADILIADAQEIIDILNSG